MHPILDQLERNFATRGDLPAASDPNLSLDYKTFRGVACGLGARIGEQTARPHVGILAPTSTACAVGIFGCWYGGRTPVPLNFLLSPEELARVMQDADIDLVLTIEHFEPLVQASGRRALRLGPETLRPALGSEPETGADALGALIYTSGTSGEPKGVCLSFDNLAKNVQACIEAAELSANQTFLSLLPQFHAFGFTTNTLVPLLMGAHVHYLPRFSPATVVNTIKERGVSVFITVASMFGALSAMKNADAEALGSLTHAVSGGEPLSPKVAQAFEQRFGKRILEGYGMTEASPVVSLNTPKAYRAGSVGRPLPGIQVRVVDETGAELPAGQTGELVVRGHCVMQEYLHKPDQTAQVLRDEALYTGDVGRVDEDGFVFITGRAKEMMIVGGENVFPIEIESVLIEHPQVAEAAVIGVADDVRGEVPVAFVMPVDGASPPSEVELRTFCRERLAGYKVPREVHVERELPRGATGKILKRVLRAEHG